MALTPIQIALKADVLASLDPLVIAARSAPRNDQALADLYNASAAPAVALILGGSDTLRIHRSPTNEMDCAVPLKGLANCADSLRSVSEATCGISASGQL